MVTTNVMTYYYNQQLELLLDLSIRWPGGPAAAESYASVSSDQLLSYWQSRDGSDHTTKRKKLERGKMET
jgi:hypothetical protein